MQSERQILSTLSLFAAHIARSLVRIARGMTRATFFCRHSRQFAVSEEKERNHPRYIGFGIMDCLTLRDLVVKGGDSSGNN